MEVLPETVVDADMMCAASVLIRFVDREMNAAAKSEAADATDELQELGADLYEGSAYLDDEVAPKFDEQSVFCGVCKGRAILFESGNVAAPSCSVSGSCEVDWVKKYPDSYRDKQGNLAVRQLLCGAREIDCGAKLKLADADGGIVPTVTRGICYVENRGLHWRQERDRSIREEPCMRPDTGIPAFDGEEYDATNSSGKQLQILATHLQSLLARKRAELLT